MVNFSLEGKIALVTGASYGIGFAIASGFAKAGATIVFNDIKQELVDKGIAALKTVKTGTFVACAAGTSADTATLKKITEIVVSLDTADANSIKSFFKWVSSSISVSSQKIDLGKEVSGLDELPPPPPELKVVL